MSSVGTICACASCQAWCHSAASSSSSVCSAGLITYDIVGSEATAPLLAKPMPFCKFCKRASERLTFLCHVGEKTRLRYLTEHSETCGTHQRIAVECAALVAMREAARGIGCQQRRKRHAAAQA